MAYDAKKPPHYVVVVQIKEVIPGARVPDGVIGSKETKREVEDVLNLSVRGTSMESAISRARSYLDTEQDNLTAEKSDV